MLRAIKSSLVRMPRIFNASAGNARKNIGAGSIAAKKRKRRKNRETETPVVQRLFFKQRDGELRSDAWLDDALSFSGELSTTYSLRPQPCQPFRRKSAFCKWASVWDCKVHRRPPLPRVLQNATQRRIPNVSLGFETLAPMCSEWSSQQVNGPTSQSTRPGNPIFAALSPNCSQLTELSDPDETESGFVSSGQTAFIGR